MRFGIIFVVVFVVITQCKADKGRYDASSTAYASASSHSGGRRRDEHSVETPYSSVHVSSSVSHKTKEGPFFVHQQEETYEPEDKYEPKEKYAFKEYKAKKKSKHHSAPKYRPSSPPAPKPKPVYSPFPIDFSTTEAALRTRIFQAKVYDAAKVLSSPKVLSLGAGLTYPDELSFLLGKVGDRNKNPDVVAFKALAKSALQTKDASKLATALVLSFQPNCSCSALSSEESDYLLEAFKKDFENQKELYEILKADANKDLTPDDEDDGYGRRLLAAGSSPVSAFACSHCWPRKQCRKLHWCRRGGRGR